MLACSCRYTATNVLLPGNSVGLGSCFGVLKTYVDTGSRFGSPTGAHLASNWRPLGVQMAPLWRPSGAHLASIWSPFGAQRAPSWPRRRPRSPSGAQEGPRRPQDEPQRRPRDPKLSPSGAQEEHKRRPSRSQELPKSSPRALGEHKRQFAEFAFSCRRERGSEGSGALWEGTWRPSWSSNWRPSVPWELKLPPKCSLAAHLGSTSPTWSPTGQPKCSF